MTLRTRLKRAERFCPAVVQGAEAEGLPPHLAWLVHLTEAQLEEFAAAWDAALGRALARKEAGEPPYPSRGWPRKLPDQSAWPGMSTFAWLTDEELQAVRDAYRRFQSLALARRDAVLASDTGLACRAGESEVPGVRDRLGDARGDFASPGGTTG